MGFDGLSVIGAAPDVVPAVDLWVAARRGVGSLELEVRADAPADVSFADGGRATLSLFAATLAPCAHVGLFLGCALGTVGWLFASGSHVALARSGSAYSLGLGPRAGFELPFGRSLALRVHGDLLVNAYRPAVSMDGAVWPLPIVTGIAGVGIAYRFP